MVFSSLVFIMIFLPVVFIGSRIFKGAYSNAFLLIASLFFYAWGEPIYILLMLFSIAVNYCVGLAFERFPKHKKAILIADICFNLGLLGYFKYLDFTLAMLNKFLHTQFQMHGIALPIGISFFTFQILSYIIDLYREEYPSQRNIVNLALYISFFPQLIAGPIVRYIDINEQLNRRQVTEEKSAEGMRRFIYGLGKKVVIANTLAEAADAIFALDLSAVSTQAAWVASVFYTLQIYYDFSGYSDMAVGLGKMFGFDFLENFNYPYTSTSIRDFWRRWHISLSTWFREYLYIPLGGNRKGALRTYFNLIVVFFITGLWHGASLNFVFWGLYHGFFSIIERLGFEKILKKAKPFAWVYTLLVVNFGWVFFRVDGLHNAFEFVRIMLGMSGGVEGAGLTIWRLVSHRAAFTAVIAVVGAGLIQKLPKAKINSAFFKYAEMAFCFFVFLLSISMLAGNTYNPFIYFRF